MIPDGVEKAWVCGSNLPSDEVGAATVIRVWVELLLASIESRGVATHTPMTLLCEPEPFDALTLLAWWWPDDVIPFEPVCPGIRGVPCGHPADPWLLICGGCAADGWAQAGLTSCLDGPMR